MACPVITDEPAGCDDGLTRLRRDSFGYCNFWHLHVLDVAIGAAVVGYFTMDYSAPMTRHLSHRPFLQELILLSGVAVRLLEGFADIIQSIGLQVLYVSTIKERYAVGISVSS